MAPVSKESKKGDATTPMSTPATATTAAPLTMTEPEPPADVPDPDEDDLDDLDDMLQDFATVKISASTQESTEPASAAAASRTAPISADASLKPPATSDEPDISEEDFEKQLQAGMADLLGELENSPEMQEQFEDLFKQMAAAVGDSGEPGTIPRADGSTPAAAAAASASASASASAESNPLGASKDASFQETIRRTMERMQTSGEEATAAASAGSGDNFMAELLKQMGSGDLGGEGSEEDFSKMLMGMMEQLTNKEILYEPIKELDDKFPEWFEKNRASTSPEDLRRYEEQRGLVREIVTKFEEASYSDDNPVDREYIVDRMQKMQAAGSPPSDLMGDMAAAQDMFGGADDQCNPQ
ncbi:hypothetical protein E4U57_001761 [Claviceps arundinis]|uniref:PEX19 protein n=1 Tax=Claviceps arundinis TaxID=1623583 RepID=A0A9P7MN47_9HYPO|nr:hypothetical protein E4U57_001761 [Claviceps arundinis]KAG5962587.1 hypothetical protein E4U56_003301 [Claviceps arundinis]